MKREFLTFVIGVLIGAIIATGVFLVLQSNDSSSDTDTGTSMEERSGGMRSDMEDFDPNSVGGERPEDANTDTETSNTTEE